jgi:hypothetical protein
MSKEKEKEKELIFQLVNTLGEGNGLGPKRHNNTFIIICVVVG